MSTWSDIGNDIGSAVNFVSTPVQAVTGYIAQGTSKIPVVNYLTNEIDSGVRLPGAYLSGNGSQGSQYLSNYAKGVATTVAVVGGLSAAGVGSSAPQANLIGQGANLVAADAAPSATGAQRNPASVGGGAVGGYGGGGSGGSAGAAASGTTEAIVLGMIAIGIVFIYRKYKHV